MGRDVQLPSSTAGFRNSVVCANAALLTAVLIAGCYIILSDDVAHISDNVMS